MICSAFFRRVGYAVFMADALKRDPIYVYYFGTGLRATLALTSFLYDEICYRSLVGEITKLKHCIAVVGIFPYSDVPESAISSRTSSLLSLLSSTIRGRWRFATEIAENRRHLAVDYLSVICTRPRYRGRGYGKALLRAVTDRHPNMVLETGNVANVGWYERNGFVVVQEYDLSGGPHIWMMCRGDKR